jgi:hypothetical protein
MNLIDIDRARINTQLAAMDEDKLLIYIELASDWLQDVVEIGPYDEYNPDVPQRVQEACVRLIVRMLNSESLNLLVRRSSVDSPDGGEMYMLGAGPADGTGASNDMLDIMTLLHGYKLRTYNKEPSVVAIPESEFSESDTDTTEVG